MSDDEDVLNFGEDAELEYGNLSGEHGALEGPGFLETYPTFAYAYKWFLGALDTVWEFAGVFQPLFKNSWVLFIIYLGISTNKSLGWSSLVPLYGGPPMEEEEEE